MKVLSIIPARSGSQGIPRKNLAILNGKPLLYYTVSASLNSSLISKTVVSTDDNKIALYAKKIGAEVINRPKKLSGNKILLEPAIFHALNYFKNKKKYIPDTIVTLQNTSPFRTAKHIDDAIRLFKKGNYDSIISGFKSKYLFWKSNKKYVKPINYNPYKRPNRQEMKKQFIENGAIYVTKHSSFQRYHNRVCGKVGLFIMPEEFSLEIDRHYDLLLGEQIFKIIRSRKI